MSHIQKKIAEQLRSRRADVDRIEVLLRSVPQELCVPTKTEELLAAMKPLIEHLNALRAKEPLTDLPSGSLEAFTTWFTTNGGYLHPGVGPAHIPGYGTGLAVSPSAAATGVAADSLLVAVPRPLLLTEDVALSDGAVCGAFGGERSRPLSPRQHWHSFWQERQRNRTRCGRRIWGCFLGLIPRRWNGTWACSPY